ncbi:MAG: hypothetical protein ACRDWY_09525 [Actinomycetes bacterium]
MATAVGHRRRGRAAARPGSATARGVDRVVRVAWTLADLAGRERPDAGDVRVALDCRGVLRRAA